MITFTSAELHAWIAAFFFPLARVLALFATAPPFSNTAISINIRLILGLAVTMAIAPALPPMPSTAPASGVGLWILAQEILIGTAMGFALRLVFTAIDAAGELISSQMGLGFATFYNPQSTGQTPVVSEVLGLLALLVFLSINGHLLTIATLVQSFTALPVSAAPLGAASWLNLAMAGGTIFASALLLALPITVALLITYLSLGVLARAAPQLNLISVGFPLTLGGGFIMLAVSLDYLSGPFQQMFEQGLLSMLGYLVPPAR